jgi:hypothetical protein
LSASSLVEGRAAEGKGAGETRDLRRVEAADMAVVVVVVIAANRTMVVGRHLVQTQERLV